MLKPLAVWITTGQEATEPDMEKWTGSKLGKEYIKAVYWHPAYLTYMRSTSCEMMYWTMYWLDEAQSEIKIAGRNIS